MLTAEQQQLFFSMIQKVKSHMGDSIVYYLQPGLFIYYTISGIVSHRQRIPPTMYVSLNGWWKGIRSQLAQTGHICPKAVWNYNSVGTSKTPTIRSWGCWIELGRVSLTQLKRLRIPLIGICNLTTGVKVQIKSSKSPWFQLLDIYDVII